jgi:hypothetical protein
VTPFSCSRQSRHRFVNTSRVDLHRLLLAAVSVHAVEVYRML